MASTRLGPTLATFVKDFGAKSLSQFGFAAGVHVEPVELGLTELLGHVVFNDLAEAGGVQQTRVAGGYRHRDRADPSGLAAVRLIKPCDRFDGEKGGAPPWFQYSIRRSQHGELPANST